MVLLSAAAGCSESSGGSGLFYGTAGELFVETTGPSCGVYKGKNLVSYNT